MADAADSVNRGRTSIQFWDELHARKSRRDGYEDVIWRLIEQAEDDR